MTSINGKCRILHVINTLGIFGTERQLVLNLSALDPGRFINYLCYLYPIDSLVEEARAAGAQVFCLGVKGKAQWLPSIYHLVKFIKTTRVDLVHTNLYESDVIGGIAARLSGIPAISTLASPADAIAPFKKQLQLSSYKLGLSKFLHRTVYKTCYRHFIAVSEHVKKSWISNSGIDEPQITVIPRAINRDLTQSESVSAITETRKKLVGDQSYPVLLNVGRLIPQKGQRYLLEAMPEILKKYPGAKLLIAGEGPMRSELEKFKKDKGLDHVVSLLGSRSDIKMLHLASDIFVFPSLSEGMPGALLEAAVLGKPCVVADIEPVQEILKNGASGLFVPPKDSPALAQAIIRLSSNQSEAQAMGLKARETVLQEHSIDKIISKLEDLYMQVINKKSKKNSGKR
jgi:glycosyltransferase involved in cell wall biosynthesis